MITYDSGLMRVLRCFGNADVLGFTELAESLQFETDLTGYYLRKLMRRKLIEKVERGQYRITPLGKSMLAHVQQLSGLTVTPRVSIMFVLSADNMYVVVERTVQPFIGKVEWPTGALQASEPLAEAAKRLATERLGIDIQPVLHGFFRRIDKLEDSIFDDKLFAVHTLDLSSELAGAIASSNPIGKLVLQSEEQLLNMSNRAKSLLDILRFTKTNAHYAEQTYQLNPADLY